MTNSKKKIFFGENIKLLRKRDHITFGQLAEATKINTSNIATYEQNQAYPPIKNIIRIADFFEVSIDFLLLWNNCLYIRNDKLMSLAEKIDKMELKAWHQIESTATSLLGELKTKLLNTKLDRIDLILTDNIHENLKILFEKNKKITSRQVAEQLNVNASMISSYRTRTKPPIEKIIKLSEIFNISIHVLMTGEKLNYFFKNDSLKEVLLRADTFLSLEQHKFLIQLMEAIIKNN